MKRYVLLLALVSFLFCAAKVFAQNEFNPSIKFHGFVKTDIMHNTRQTVDVREGHFSIMPADENLDADGDDINANPYFNILSIQTRLKGFIDGVKVGGVETSGYIEGEFFGTSNADVNGFRLRHAFVDLDWEQTKLRVGQFWHPMFVTDCYPSVVNFNTGVPFQPFSRNPQIRLTQDFGAIEIIAAAMSQRDFTSPGPDGSSSKYMRNASVPEGHLQLRYNAEKVLFGVGGGYKILSPRTETDQNYKTDETVGSYESIAYLKLNFEPVTLKFEGVYGQNLTNLVMLGGYGVTDYDQTTGEYEYTNQNIMSAWGEAVIGLSDNVDFSIFGGYTKAMGTDEELYNFSAFNQGDYKLWTRGGGQLSEVYRVAPSIKWDIGKVRLAGEIEYTTAVYGDSFDENAEAQETHSVSNLRTLFGVYIFF